MPHESIDVLLIRVAGRALALPVSAVREVLAAVSLSPPPTGDDPREGILNLRGRSVPVVDLAGPLGVEPTPITPAQHLVVLEVEGECLAVRSETPATLSAAIALAADEAGSTSPLLGPPVRVEEQIVATLDPAAIRRRLRAGSKAGRVGSADSGGGTPS